MSLTERVAPDHWSLSSLNCPEPGDTTVLTTLIRGLRVLELIAGGAGKATAKSVQADLGLKQATVYHLLRTLRSSGHIVRLKGGFYDVGPGSLTLGRSLAVRTTAPTEIMMLLARLHNKTHETCYLSGWHHGAIVLQHYLSTPHSMAISRLDVGYTYNMHARASCRAVLAFLSENDIERMFEGVALQRLTPKTVADYDALLVTLAAIRSKGYAIEQEEFQEGACCIAAPFFDRHLYPRGSFTVSVPVERFNSDGISVVHAVRESAIMATNLFTRGILQ
ncbi:IclR family transcriptional regulator [Dactylosporangium sp. CA-233914]|uniref:IclR family transcriptional regulator n=1 Tax=Dactylosporangium sp. CA-233914 TaxID=3239934 RepID=UPI003D911CE8